LSNLDFDRAKALGLKTHRMDGFSIQFKIDRRFSDQLPINQNVYPGWQAGSRNILEYILIDTPAAAKDERKDDQHHRHQEKRPMPHFHRPFFS
jgi:hypothetical protein